MAPIRQRQMVQKPMTHEERQALIRKPFFIQVHPPQKRWGGVQLINDEDWMRQGMSPAITRPMAHSLSAADARVEDLIDSLEDIEWQ